MDLKNKKTAKHSEKFKPLIVYFRYSEYFMESVVTLQHQHLHAILMA